MDPEEIQERKELTALERLVIFRDFDDRRSALHDRDFAGSAEIGVARLVRLLTRDATPVAPPARDQVRFSL